MYSPKEEYGKLLKTLKKACKSKGYSYYVLAKKAGISTSTMYNIMNKETMPSLFTLLETCNVLGLTLRIVDAGNKNMRGRSEEELIHCYRGLSENQRQWLNTAIDMLKRTSSMEGTGENKTGDIGAQS